MDKKTGTMIATVVTVLMCGCPGLFAFCFGAIMMLAGLMPGSDIDVFGSSDPTAALVTGFGTLCLGGIFIAIPIIVGIVAMRSRSVEEAVIDYNEPLPPAS